MEFSGKVGSGAQEIEQRSVVLDASARSIKKSSALTWI